LRKYQRIFYASLWQLKQEFFFSKRTYTLLIVISMYICSLMEPVSSFCTEVKISASPFGFVHIFNDYICQTIIMIGAVFLFSTSPFKTKCYYYLVYRTGKTELHIGNILYIWISSALYLLIIVLASLLGLGGNVIFETGWGKIWGTLARTSAASQIKLQFAVNEYIIGKYNPFFASFTTIVLELFCFVWLGLCIYLVNYTSGKNCGGIVASVFIFLDAMIYNSWTPWAYRFSPITLSHISTFSKESLLYGLSISYAYWFFCIGIAIMSMIIILLSAKEKDLNE
jgi:hypothetical protein